MKKYLACMLIVLTFLCAAAQAEYALEDGYRVIAGENGKYGLEDAAGKAVLEPVYDEIGVFFAWPDGGQRCWLVQDGKYGWYPATDGGAVPCKLESKPEIFSNYVVCDDRIWSLDGTPANDTLYARLIPLNENRLAAWEFTGTEAQWTKLYDSWGGRMDYAAGEAVILDENLEAVFSLACDFIRAESGGLCAFMDFDADPEGDQWDAGYVNPENGTIACRKRTNLDLGDFDSGYARSFQNGKGGANLIDLRFEKVFSGDYDWITAFIDGYAVLCNEIWDGENISGYRCTLINDRLEEIMEFKTGTAVNDIWCNGQIIVNDGDYGLYYVHDLEKKLLLKGKFVGKITTDDRVRYQNEEGRWGYISGSGENVIPAVYIDARDFSEGYAAVQDAGGKWMLINPEGENVFGCSWDYVEDFRMGHAYVRDAGGGCLINAAGEKVRPALARLHSVSDDYHPYAPLPDWDGGIAEIYAQSHGLRIFKSDEGKYGVMDADENILAPAVYDEAQPPREYGQGIYRVLLKRDERWGWCGTDGFCDAKWINCPDSVFAGLTLVSLEAGSGFGVPGDRYLVHADGGPTDNVAYAELQIIGDGILAMREKGSEITFVLDEGFRQLFSLECDTIYSVREGLCCFRKGDLWGFCDLEGNVIVEPVSSMATEFVDGYAVVTRYSDRRGEEQGLINARGELVVEFGKYAMIYGFKDGYCVIRTEDHSFPDEDEYGSFTRPWHDYIIVDTGLRTCTSFSGNAHDNRSGDLFVYFDREDSVMIDARGNEILRAESFGTWSNGYCRFKQNGLCGFLDEEGRIVLPAKYQDAGDFGDNGLAAVKDEDGWKFIDVRGETAFEFETRGSYPGAFIDGYAAVDYEWYINEKGEKVAPMHVEFGF